jgi:16S rRNA (guanine527-N7)-methyltransferase
VGRVHRPLPSRVRDAPDLPGAYHDVVDAGLAAMGIALPATGRAAIDGHVRLLLAWTDSINLTAIRDPVAAATIHVLDSLSAISLLRTPGTSRILDLGSGGGLPGIPLAAATPVDALLVEPIGKKARFLETAVDAVGLADTVRVATTRAEVLAHDPDHRGAWPVVTARAVASLADLMELSLPLLMDGGRLIAWKRGDLTVELAGAESAAGPLGGADFDVIDVTLPALADHRLVIVTRRGPVPTVYPRPPAARKRRPAGTDPG